MALSRWWHTMAVSRFEVVALIKRYNRMCEDGFLMTGWSVELALVIAVVSVVSALVVIGVVAVVG